MCLIDGCGELYHMDYDLDGCGLSITTKCSNGHISVWDSSEVVSNKKNRSLHNNNLCFAAAVVLSGNNFDKIKQFCKIQTISKSTFYCYQSSYICPTVEKFFNKEQVSFNNFIYTTACIILVGENYKSLSQEGSDFIWRQTL